MKLKVLAATAAAVAVVLSGCATPSTTPAAAPVAPVTGTIVVDATPSLTVGLRAIGAAFERLHPGAKVAFRFAGSARQVLQIEAGRKADVYATANLSTIQSLQHTHLVQGAPRVIASSVLEIVVPVDNPAKIVSLKDFADESKKIAICVVTVPCGASAATIFGMAGISGRPDSLTPNASAALRAVESGKADAALVYRSDVISSRAVVEGIEIPQASRAANRYLITRLVGSVNSATADAFVNFVLSFTGRRILQAAGFAIS
jgi:molybdate transport system substrate-binding protein